MSHQTCRATQGCRGALLFVSLRWLPLQYLCVFRGTPSVNLLHTKHEKKKIIITTTTTFFTFTYCNYLYWNCWTSTVTTRTLLLGQVHFRYHVLFKNMYANSYSKQVWMESWIIWTQWMSSPKSFWRKSSQFTGHWKKVQIKSPIVWNKSSLKSVETHPVSLNVVPFKSDASLNLWGVRSKLKSSFMSLSLVWVKVSSLQLQSVMMSITQQFLHTKVSLPAAQWV